MFPVNPFFSCTGVTILASSGDDGAVSPTASSDSMRCGYNPSFPATSPYVTAVGGTMVSAWPCSVCPGVIMDQHIYFTMSMRFSRIKHTLCDLLRSSS